MKKETPQTENPLGLIGQIHEGTKKDHQARLLSFYVGAAVLLAFLALVSLAPQVGERLGTLSVKKQTQESQAGEGSRPRIYLFANPTKVILGEPSTLSWNAVSFNSCIASNDWSGSKPLIGQEIVRPLKVRLHTYTLKCASTRGGEASLSATRSARAGEASASATVNVFYPPPPSPYPPQPPPPPTSTPTPKPR